MKRLRDVLKDYVCQVLYWMAVFPPDEVLSEQAVDTVRRLLCPPEKRGKTNQPD